VNAERCLRAMAMSSLRLLPCGTLMPFSSAHCLISRRGLASIHVCDPENVAYENQTRNPGVCRSKSEQRWRQIWKQKLVLQHISS